jgi:hypothetical protein
MQELKMQVGIIFIFINAIPLEKYDEKISSDFF